MRGNQRLFNAVDFRRVGQMHGVVHLDHRAVGQINVVDYARIRRNDVHIVFPAQAFLNDLHVEQTEKAAAEAESERGGSLRLISECGVVQLKFRHAEPELIVIRRVDRINPAEHHRFDLLESGQRLGAGIFQLGNGIADPGIGRALDIRNDVTDRSGGKFRRRRH